MILFVDSTTDRFTSMSYVTSITQLNKYRDLKTSGIVRFKPLVFLKQMKPFEPNKEGFLEGPNIRTSIFDLNGSLVASHQ